MQMQNEIKNSQNLPLITVITVVYNAEKVIEETIRSVIAQTYQNLEYIIIDGGSTDKTLDIIKKYENRIALWISEKDRGIFHAMDKGIDLAKGKYINFMNAGDRFYADDIIEKIFSLNPQEDFIYGDIETSYHIGDYKYTRTVNAPQPNKIWKKAICHQSLFVKKNVMAKNKFTDNNLKDGPKYDTELTLKAFFKDKLSFRKENLIIAYYLGGGSSSTNPYESPDFWKTIKKRFKRWKVVAKYNNKPAVHLFYILVVLRDIIQIPILKLMPARLRYYLFSTVIKFKLH